MQLERRMFARKKNPYPVAVLLVRSQTNFGLEWHIRWPCQQKLFLNTKLMHLRHSERIKFFLLHHTYVGFILPLTSQNHCHNTKSFRKAGRKLNTAITGSLVISLGLNHTEAVVCKPQPQNMPGSFAKQSALMSPCSLERSPAKTSWCPLSAALQGRRSKEQLPQSLPPAPLIFLTVICRLWVFPGTSR